MTPMTKPTKRPPKPSRVQPGHLPDCPGCIAKPGDGARRMYHTGPVVPLRMSPGDFRCIACDGSGQRCNRCGETESACGCEEGFDPGPCDDCKGTGK